MADLNRQTADGKSELMHLKTKKSAAKLQYTKNQARLSLELESDLDLNTLKLAHTSAEAAFEAYTTVLSAMIAFYEEKEDETKQDAITREMDLVGSSYADLNKRYLSQVVEIRSSQ